MIKIVWQVLASVVVFHLKKIFYHLCQEISVPGFCCETFIRLFNFCEIRILKNLFLFIYLLLLLFIFFTHNDHLV